MTLGMHNRRCCRALIGVFGATVVDVNCCLSGAIIGHVFEFNSQGIILGHKPSRNFFGGGGKGGTNIPAMTPCVKPQTPERQESISYLTIMSGLTAILSAPNPKIRSALQLFCLFGCFDRVLFWSHSETLPPHVNGPLCPSKDKIISVLFKFLLFHCKEILHE